MHRREGMALTNRSEIPVSRRRRAVLDALLVPGDGERGRHHHATVLFSIFISPSRFEQERGHHQSACYDEE